MLKLSSINLILSMGAAITIGIGFETEIVGEITSYSLLDSLFFCINSNWSINASNVSPSPSKTKDFGVAPFCI